MITEPEMAGEEPEPDGPPPSREFAGPDLIDDGNRRRWWPRGERRRAGAEPGPEIGGPDVMPDQWWSRGERRGTGAERGPEGAGSGTKPGPEFSGPDVAPGLIGDRQHRQSRSSGDQRPTGEEPGPDGPGTGSGPGFGAPDAGPDLISAPYRRPWWTRTERRRLWTGVLGGAVAASAIWGAALRGADYGHHAPPDTYGYRIPGDLCSSLNLEPLTDALPAGGFDGNDPEIRRGPALDQARCELESTFTTGDGWVADYTVRVVVELHKKTDPRAEFADSYGPPGPPEIPLAIGGDLIRTGARSVTRPYAGLGDLAYLTSGDYQQTLSVLRGGAVVSLAVAGHNVWQGDGPPPTDRHGAPDRPFFIDTSGLRKALPVTVGHLMRVLSR